MRALRTASGYYIDVGASELIIQKKIKLKKPKAATTTAAAAAAAAAAAPTSSDDLFSMALPVRGKERAAPAQVEEVDMVEKPAAFE